MKFSRAKDFSHEQPWGALDIAEFDGITVRLHWSDQPYVWHVNDGEEVFAVMDGTVEMHYRKDGEEKVYRMSTGDICHAGAGDEHLAQPLGPARILVIERKGSV